MLSGLLTNFFPAAEAIVLCYPNTATIAVSVAPSVAPQSPASLQCDRTAVAGGENENVENSSCRELQQYSVQQSSAGREDSSSSSSSSSRSSVQLMLGTDGIPKRRATIAARH